jgi:hypothetical protein
MKKQLLFLTFLFLWIFSNGNAQDIATIANEKPVEVSGTFTVFSSYYNVNGIDPRRKDFSWYITGNPNFKIYGIDIPFSLTVSEQERSFRQPFNQFLISPSYKWAKLHLGYTNLNWSPFTWAGQTAFGAGIELNPKKFRFGFLYGRLNRSVEEDLTSLETQTPAFKRMGYSTRFGFGTETSHVDLIYLKGKDDENSLNSIPTKTEVLPAENVVIGLSSKVKFTEKLFWNADLAASAYTRDIRAIPFADDEPGFLKSLGSLLQINSSTQFYKAYQSDFSYVEKKFKIKLKYKRVEPDFKSMGAYYFQTDVENITLEPSVNITKYKLKVNSSIGRQKNNLLNQKSFTSTRLIGNIGADWSPTNIFGINALYSNYSGEQSKGLKIPNQATQQSYVSQNITVSPRLTFVDEKITHFHNLVANKQWLTDKNPNTSLLTQYEVNNLNLTSTVVFNRTALTISGSYLLAIFDSNANRNRLDGFSLNVNKAFFDNKLLTSISGSETFQKLNSEPFSQMLTISSQNSYKITDHHGVTLVAQYLDNQAKSSSFNSFSEYNIDLGYTYTF